MRLAGTAILLVVPVLAGCYTVLNHPRPATDAMLLEDGEMAPGDGVHGDLAALGWGDATDECMRCHVGHAGHGLDAIGRRTDALDRTGYDWQQYDSRWQTTYGHWYGHLPGSWIDYYYRYDPYAYDPWYGYHGPYVTHGGGYGGGGSHSGGASSEPRETGTRHLWGRGGVRTQAPAADGSGDPGSGDIGSTSTTTTTTTGERTTPAGGGVSRPSGSEPSRAEPAAGDEERGERHLWGRGRR
jgi:hypothetical protein